MRALVKRIAAQKVHAGRGVFAGGNSGTAAKSATGAACAVSSHF